MLKKIHNKLYIGILIIVVSLAANIIYAHSQKLNEPIFLKHYYEERYHTDGSNFDIYYLTNAKDNIEVINVSFPNINVTAWVRYTEIENYKYYDKKKAVIELKFDTVENESDKINKIILDTATVTFNNGQTKEVNLGKLIIHKDEHTGFLDHIMAGGSSSGTSKEVYKVDNEIIINNITTDLIEESNGLITMNIISNDNKEIEILDKLRNDNKRDVDEAFERKLHEQDDTASIAFDDIRFPISIKNSLSILITFNKPNDIRKFDCYRILYAINYEDIDGKKGTDYLLNVRYKPYFSEKDLRAFVKSRGE